MKIDISKPMSVNQLRTLLGTENSDVRVEFVRTLKKDQVGVCWCGCGAATKSRFAPGHDSKFHSLAKQVARGQAEMPTEFVHEEAEADFVKHVEAERPLWAAKQAAVKLVADSKPVRKERSVEERVAAAVESAALDVEVSMGDLMALVG